MADRLFEAIGGGEPRAAGAALLRLEPLGWRGPIDAISFSGGVAEYIYGAETRGFGDLGPLLAREIAARVAARGLHLVPPSQSIRATVIGASQYTIQMSGSTIYVSPFEALPLRNLPVVAPDFALGGEAVDADAIAESVRAVLRRLDLDNGESPVAVFVSWHGSATFARLDGFCRGILAGLDALLARGQPLVLAGDGDIGGLLGIHCREELGLASPIVSIDGLELKEFDYIDIGALIDTSGAVPVVIKSLVFPESVQT
jgi:ethanolamine utilization protein EutA